MNVAYLLTDRNEQGSMPVCAEMILQAVQRTGGERVKGLKLFLTPGRSRNLWYGHVWRLAHAARIVQSIEADVYHLIDGSMAACLPPSILHKTVVTVHDFIPMRQYDGLLPGRPSVPASLWIRAGLSRLQTAGALHAVSASTADDCRRYLKRKDAMVIPNAVRNLPPPGPVDFDLSRPYLLHVGNNAAYKNRMGVLRIFQRLSARTGLRLIMSGAPPRSSHRTFVRTHQLPVTFTGPVSDAALHTLYREATALLFPSLWEGFGMPVLEAMDCGCPVLCSDRGALPEVAGDAGIFLDPEDLDAWASQVLRLMEDSERRTTLIQSGKHHAAQFASKGSGQRFMSIYEALNRQGPPGPG